MENIFKLFYVYSRPRNVRLWPCIYNMYSYICISKERYICLQLFSVTSFFFFFLSFPRCWSRWEPSENVHFFCASFHSRKVGFFFSAVYHTDVKARNSVRWSMSLWLEKNTCICIYVGGQQYKVYKYIKINKMNIWRKTSGEKKIDEI